MKGLMLKDFYTLGQNRRYLLMMAVLYVAIGLFTDNPAMILGMMIVSLAILSLTLFSSDEFAKWDNYALTLPVTRRQIVSARYATSALMLLAGVAVAAVFTLLLRLFPGNSPQPITEALAVIGVVLWFVVVMEAILFPLCYRLGVEKARLFVVLLALLPTTLIMVAGRLNIALPPRETLVAIVVAAALAAPVLYAFSWKLSCDFYAKKQF